MTGKRLNFKSLLLRVAIILFSLMLVQGLSSLLLAETPAVPFLQMGVDARGVALGRAASAVADDASALYWNPAALTQMPRHTATLMHASHIESASLNYAAYGHNGGRGAFGLSFQHFAVGDLDRVDENGADLGSIAPQDSAGSFGYGYRWDRMSMGVSVKHVQSKVVQSARATVADVGFLYRAGAKDRIRVSFVAANVGQRLKFDHATEEIPLTLKVGSAFSLKNRLTLSLEGGLPKKGDPFGAAGLESWLIQSTAWSMAFRLGINTDQLSQGPESGGFFGGIGIGVGPLKFDYAAGFYGELGIQHLASLSFRFGEAEWTPREIKAPKPKKQALTAPAAPAAAPLNEPAIQIPTRPYIPYDPVRSGFQLKKQRVYEVKQGDTYESIAEKIYGKKGLWRKIYHANQHFSKGTSPIPGEKILIPPLE